MPFLKDAFWAILPERHVALRRSARLLQWLVLGLLVYDLGVAHAPWLSAAYAVAAALLLAWSVYRRRQEKNGRRLEWLPVLALGLCTLALLVQLIRGKGWLSALESLHQYYAIGIGLYLLYRFSLAVRRLFHQRTNPATLFIGSFAALVALGALLLLLPAATPNGIRWVDALFTATSAVCVTGLTVVDTAQDFTFFGRCVILALIQLGGLGILTFTSFFAYFFQGGSSLQETLHLRDMVSSEQLSGVFKVVVKIVVFTLAIEAAGAVGIWLSTDADLFASWWERAFFAVFHSVSAFCNAGFSTESAGLYDEDLRFNYGLQWMIMALIVLGGIGFNILNNLYEFVKEWLKSMISRLGGEPRPSVRARIISLNSRLVIHTTLLLLAAGWIFFLFSEWQTPLSAHAGWWGKVTTAFFCSVTPRTAGFNTIDMGSLSAPGILFMMMLMWIGASPASTGGGVKTSTFALAILNIGAVVRGRAYIETGHREVPAGSVQRAFAIIALSVLAIGAGVLALGILEPGQSLTAIGFECVSAYSTVGLSLGITNQLGDGSKWVLILLMFTGRVGAINLLTGMLRRIHHIHYRYPQESVIIN